MPGSSFMSLMIALYSKDLKRRRGKELQRVHFLFCSFCTATAYIGQLERWEGGCLYNNHHKHLSWGKTLTKKCVWSQLPIVDCKWPFFGNCLVTIRVFYKNTIFSEIHIAQSWFLVLRPIKTNARKCIFPKYVSFPLNCQPTPIIIKMANWAKMRFVHNFWLGVGLT